MPQAFQARKFFIPKTDPKQEVYKPVPYYFGTLSTQDAADQIAEESSLTKGDVLNVLDRYQRYVIKNLQKGYKVELLGFGTVYNRFVTEKGVATAEEVKATHIRTIVPGFSPSYTILNGARNVLDRYQRYVIKNLQKGYKVELLGFGTVYNRFVTEKG
ncbi:HU family DNA-binding protein, partial [Parabacteroides distasonis]|uniref:HU family DNA-binding protein n=1 Tax=Parabacteroides distasonis TaxID=823 RepID=UPI00216B3546